MEIKIDRHIDGTFTNGAGDVLTLIDGSVDWETMDDVDSETYNKVMNWIDEHIRPSQMTHSSSSYGLKHILEKDTGVYLTNNQFKSAMIEAGYKLYNTDCPNCSFKIKLIENKEQSK